MAYQNINEYINTIFIIFKMIYNKAFQQKNSKLQTISLIIYNYALKKAKDNNFDLNMIHDKENVDLTPFFEYVNYYNIQLYDFSNIKIEDVDINKETDLERYVLSHIYYITQK